MITYDITLEDIEPLLEGLALLGTGGGGSPEWGREILLNDLARGRRITLIDPDSVEDDALIVSGGIMGSVKTLEKMSFSDIVRAWENKFEVLEALRVNETRLQRKIDYIVPFEVGGLNCPVIMSACARLGIPCIDGDALGRAAPETQMTSFIGHGISLTPMPLVDVKGNVVIILESSESTYPDELGRWMITRGGGMGANSHYAMNGLQLKEAVIPRTISYSLGLGRVIQHARDTDGDPVQSVVEFLGGLFSFTGTLVGLFEEDKGGFLHTRARISGTGGSSGSTIELTIKNEVMLCKLNDRVRAIFPDLICMMDPKSGRAIMSVDLEVGREITVIGVPCHERLRRAIENPVGVKAFSPARFGHPEIQYQPIEELDIL